MIKIKKKRKKQTHHRDFYWILKWKGKLAEALYVHLRRDLELLLCAAMTCAVWVWNVTHLSAETCSRYVVSGYERNLHHLRRKKQLLDAKLLLSRQRSGDCWRLFDLLIVEAIMWGKEEVIKCHTHKHTHTNTPSPELTCGINSFMKCDGETLKVDTAYLYSFLVCLSSRSTSTTT